MPPAGIPDAVIWALGVVGAAVLAKSIMTEWQRINAELQKQASARKPESVDRTRLPTLRRDPKTGIYHVD